MLKILMIGALPPPIGGITVSFKNIVDLLKCRSDVHIEIVDFNEIKTMRGRNLLGFLSLCQVVIAKSKRVDVITVYFSSKAVPTLGLLLLVLSRIVHKPLVLRKAAGTDYMSLGYLRGRLAHFVVRHVTLFLAQTKNLVRLARKRGISEVRWYPTSRSMLDIDFYPSMGCKSCRRFVFVGQVREYKGIYEIIQASEQFGEGVHVDVYGPIFDDLDKNIFDSCKRVKYCGILPPNDVIRKLKEYDMLLLPTKASTEGYPGVVFEGYSAGLPIITTRCGGIPEIVDETCGIFVAPGSPEDLFHAMMTIVNNEEIYRKLRMGVFRKRKEFDAAIWADRFVQYCYESKHSFSVS